MADEKSSLLKALHAVQANAPTLRKDATGQVGSRHYKYTPLDTIVETLRPLLEKHGLVWVSLPTGTHDAPTLYYRLLHVESNESIEAEMPIMVGENPTSQAMGSAITYARRYALTAVLNLVADDDDDGQAAQSYGRGSQGAAKPRPQQDSGEMATEPQKKRIQRDLRMAGDLHTNGAVQANLYRELFNREPPTHKPIWENVTKKQAGILIDRLSQGAIPTGESDVPSDGFQESLQPEPEMDLPWEERHDRT